MNVCGIHGATVNELCHSRSLATLEKIILSIFIHFSKGGNEAGIGLRAASHFYGISMGTLSNYFRHDGWSLRTVLSSVSHAEIRRPSAIKRRKMEGMVVGFSKAVCFVDGTIFPG